MDYFRTDCIKSYFEIVALVNKGNKVINEQTEAVFFIKDKKLFLGVNEHQKFCLCIKEDYWRTENGPGHDELKYFLVKLLNNPSADHSNLNSVIKSHLFKLSD